MPKATRQTDIVHSEPEAVFKAHKPEYSDMCNICQPRLVRSKRIAAFHKNLKEFGYAGLTLDEVATAYDLAINPKHEITEYDDIIARLIRTQLKEAGLV